MKLVRPAVMRLLSALTVTTLIWMGQLSAAPPAKYEFLPLTDALSSASSKRKPMLLYFGRYGCAICRKMHAEVFVDAGIEANYNTNFILAYVDIESGNRIRLANGERITEMQFATRSRIFGTPTFIFFSPEQKPLFKKVGFQSIERMNRYHDFIIEGIYRDTPLNKYLSLQ